MNEVWLLAPCVFVALAEQLAILDEHTFSLVTQKRVSVLATYSVQNLAD